LERLFKLSRGAISDLAAPSRAAVAEDGGAMSTGGRLAVAGACALASLLATWAIYQSRAFDSPRPRIEISGPVLPPARAAAPALWVLAIGVSRYEDPGLQLDFAAADARAIAETLREAAGGEYREVHAEVLTDQEVTRESVLNGLARFLGKAGPNDVVVLFVAGHGVRDLASGGYYFLPYPATPQNLLTEGLRMTDFDEMLGVVRRNVRAVVVMLDTCHAGALSLPPESMGRGDELASQITAGDGFFLLAATKPGEESKETADLGHGAFTYAVLEALHGAADADGDDILTVSELFGYVARRVPILTGGQQHPYHKMEGTDLTLLTYPGGTMPGPVIRAQAPTAPSPTANEASLNTIGVMEFQNLRADPRYDWINKALRVAFNTELSKVKALRVYSTELIDRTAKTRGTDALYTARELGIGRLLTGAFHVTDHTLRIDARIVDAATGVNEASDSVEGKLTDFFELQKKLVLSMLRRLRVRVSPEEGESIQTRTNTDVDAYKLLLEAEGIVEPPPTAVPRATSQAPDRQSSAAPLGRPGVAETNATRSWFGIALAAEPQPDLESQAREVLEQYRKAIEAKDVDAVARLYESFSQRQREALRDYFENADDLDVEIDDVSVMSHPPDMVVSFTRRDRFTDAQSGKPVRLEVRLTKILVHAGDSWRIGEGR
jgi:uncharacterized caspase-like protein